MHDLVYQIIHFWLIEQKWRQSLIDAGSEDEDAEGVLMSMAPQMFCKTLTASDTSTHGCFSVPHRAVMDRFPTLEFGDLLKSKVIRTFFLRMQLDVRCFLARDMGSMHTIIK